MNQNMRNTIQKLAGAPASSDALGDRMVAELVKGAQSNPRLGNVQYDSTQAEMKLASAGVTPLDLAHMAGSVAALSEAGFTKKEAAEYLGVTAEALEDVLTVLAG